VVLVTVLALLLSRQGPVWLTSTPAHFASQALPNVFWSLLHTGAYILAQKQGPFLTALVIFALTTLGLLLLLAASWLIVSIFTLLGWHSPLCAILAPLHLAVQALPYVWPSMQHTGW
jgi:hypothetical protein